MAEGQCSCGEVRFEIAADVSNVIVCHCSICRKSTGSNGIPVVVFAKEAFRWTRGEEKIATWKKPGADWQKCFCKICGSPLPGINDETRMYAPAGIITGCGKPQKVAHHIFVNSKAVWDEIGDEGIQHPEEFGTAQSN
ncbi:MAG: GFA family protein [Kordiimonas sp.]